MPEDAVVLLLQIDKGVTGLAVPDVWQASLDTQTQVITNDLRGTGYSKEEIQRSDS